MSHWMLLAFASFFSFSAAFGTAEAINSQVLEETLYHDYQKVISGHKNMNLNSLSGFTSYEQSLFVDALQDMVEEGNARALSALDEVNTLHYDLVQKFRMAILRIKYNQAPYLPIEVASELVASLKLPVVELRLIYLIAAYEEELIRSGHKDIVTLAMQHPQYFDIKQDDDGIKEVTDSTVADLFYKSPDVATYMNGEYVKSVKIFMYCRHNRLYPCLMIMRNVHGEPVRLTDGKLWSNPALASSSKGLPSYQRNGNTPTGVLTIDSVMPTADQQTSFGKFRRMILNFIPKSKNEVLLKSLLPQSSVEDDWWKAGTVSRDIGRNLLRIHGTGKINLDPNTPYFPFMRTSGCIAQRENTYNDTTFKDQRSLLDSVMAAMDLAAEFENEPKIKGLLYLIEIDDMNSPVTLEDLRARGIE